MEKDQLPPGWTRHTAPSGHVYYYNKATKTSTYERPTPPVPAQLLPSPADSAPIAKRQRQIDPEAAAWARQYTSTPLTHSHPHPPHRREHPLIARPIPDTQWLLVVTTRGRPFVHNPHTGATLWMPPEDVQAALERMKKDEIVELVARCRGLKTGDVRARWLSSAPSTLATATAGTTATAPAQTQTAPIYDDEDVSESELIEPDDAPVSTGIIRQRNRTPEEESGESSSGDSDSDGSDGNDDSDDSDEEEEEQEENGAVEFDEDDIEYQLQAMLADQAPSDGLPGASDNDDNVEDAPTHDQRIATFKVLLADMSANPFSPWEAEFPKLAADSRYTSLHTTAERKHVFEEWAKMRAQELNAMREKEVPVSPEEQFEEFLRQFATPKLFYQEFKRKYRKETGFKESRLSDREKEKLYREYIARKRH
ncbi:uncharacterized protein V1518DRAFT_378590 [Limtongia smithiae]|uniref:uncharacterized protein n=1 Tax=Limtongia smithiae TaxID=1125753 RepID=UPI0034CEF101